MAFPAQPARETTDEVEGDNFRWLEPEEERALFDERTRAILGISGEEFLRKLDDGDYDEVADDVHYLDIHYLIMLCSIAR